MSLIQIKDDLDNAQGWIDSALDGITENLEPEDMEGYFKAFPELKALNDKLVTIRKELKEIWTPELRKQLRVEEEYQSELEDRADAMSY